VLRLSLLFAVLDCSPAIRAEHVTAALALWDYSEASARRIFGARTGLTVADKILDALGRAGSMTRTEISNLFGRNKPAAEIDAALALLIEKGKARRTFRPSGGRSVEVWEAI
jgi:hypothetical protein